MRYHSKSFLLTIILFCFSLFSFGQNDHNEKTKVIKYYNTTIIPVCESGKTVKFKLNLDHLDTPEIKNIYSELLQYRDDNRLLSLEILDSEKTIKMVYSEFMSLDDIYTSLSIFNIDLIRKDY